jgi:hypothetical protein
MKNLRQEKTLRDHGRHLMGFTHFAGKAMTVLAMNVACYGRICLK